MQKIEQKEASVLLHWGVGLVMTAAMLFATYTSVTSVFYKLSMDNPIFWNACITLVLVFCLLWSLARFTVVEPYQRLVISQFGRYIGVDGREGLSWMIPFYSGVKISTALTNFETDVVKVNDRSGSPIDIAVVVVSRIVDPAKAVYMVQSVETFVKQQVIAGIRIVAASHDYDGDDSKAAKEAAAESGSDAPTRYTLRGDLAEIAEELRKEAQQGLGDIGVELVEVRITHLAYSREIAAAMLKRQQAQAVVAARETIVKGAVSIIEDTMKMLKDKDMELDEDRRATLTSNLLVVLSSDREATPVLPLGA